MPILIFMDKKCGLFDFGEWYVAQLPKVSLLK